jgi:hypothetical protein
MEKQEAKSKWDELVRQLGAEVSPESEQLVETGPPPPSDPVSSLARASSEADDENRPLVPKRPAAGWDNLANEFGLPVPEEPAPIVEEVASASKQVIEPRDVDADRPRRDRSGPERREKYDERRESSRRGRESSAQARESSERGREPSARGRGASDRDRDATERRRGSSSRRTERSHQRREPRDRRDIDPRGERDNQSAESTSLDRDASSAVQHEREEQKPESAEQPSMLAPAVSLWHKIFGSPADQSAKLEEISSRPDDQESISDGREEQSKTRDFALDRDRSVDDMAEASAQDELERPIEPGIDSEQSERDERRPRRSRRRRRGRGGKGEPVSGGAPRAGRRPHRAREMEAGGELDRSADDEDDSNLDLSPDDENGMADEGDSSEAGESRSARSRAALQRSIPSWDEAIGFIVDVNMQSRSQRRQSGGSGSPRGRSRGRRKN